MQINIQPVTIHPHVANIIQIDSVKIRGIGSTASAIIICTYISTNGHPINNVSVSMPSDVYDQWGTDDTYVVDFTLSQLGLTRA